jgi:5-methylcytosine-specific restriction protein A
MRSDRVPLPDGLTRNELLDAIEELKKGIPGGYGPSTFNDVLHEGKRYPPKPIVGIAATEKSGFNYIGGNFTGGLKSKCFKILIDNEFEIVEKSGESAVRKIKAAHETVNWSDEELHTSIEANLDMMARHRKHKPI